MRMSEFKDKKGQVWKVELDPILVSEVKEKHSIDLANLEADPMLKLRSDPMKLVAVIHILCQAQIEERSLTPVEFAKILQFPCDEMVAAVEVAIVNFFPSGRHSFVIAALANYAEMGRKTDTWTIEEQKTTLSDPQIPVAMSRIASQEKRKILEKAINPDTQVGMSFTEGST
jgi:hypothetical protein